jgi:hypothetical protein
MACAAQYNARIFELRRRGFNIENRVEMRDDGSRHSWFRLIPSTPAPIPNAPKPEAPKPALNWENRPRLTGLPLFDSVVRP